MPRRNRRRQEAHGLALADLIRDLAKDKRTPHRRTHPRSDTNHRKAPR